MSGAWHAKNLDRPEFFSSSQAAVGAGREVTPLVEALNRKVAVDGSCWAPVTGGVILGCRVSAPRSAAGCAVANVRPPRGAVAGARVGRGQRGLLLSFTLAAARTAGNRSMRRLSQSTDGQGRREGMISSPASSNTTVKRTRGVASSQRYGRARKLCAPFARRGTTAPAAYLSRYTDLGEIH